MGWIILSIFAAIIVLVAIVAAVKSQPLTADSPKDSVPVRGISIGVAGGAAVLWLILSLVFSATQVPAGHIGVQYKFGKITGVVHPGFHLVAPWSSVTNANTQVQAHTFDQLAAFSKETQNVDVSATINYSVNPSSVQWLYTNVGPDWFDKLVGTRINQFFKDETVKFLAVKIAPHRDQIRQDVRARIRAALKPYSVNIEDLLIDNISFSPKFTAAIEDKQIATQQAQAAQNRVATARYKASQLIATAKGQAQAQRLRRETLTPLLVEQNAIDKLNPNVQVIMVPSGSNFLLPNLLTSPTAPSTK